MNAVLRFGRIGGKAGLCGLFHIQFSKKMQKNIDLTPISYSIGYSERMEDHIRISFTQFDFKCGRPIFWAVHSGRYCMDRNTGQFLVDRRVFAGAYLPQFLFESEHEAAAVYSSFHSA